MEPKFQIIHHYPMHRPEELPRSFQVLLLNKGSELSYKRYCKALEPWHEWVGKVVCLNPHEGRVQVYNQGMLAALEEGSKGPLLLADSDYLPVSDPFQPLYDRLCLEDVGIVSPQIISDSSESEVEVEGQTEDVSGACKLRYAPFPLIALRPELIYHLGVFDEQYERDYADVDYGYTARAREWSVWKEPKSQWAREGAEADGETCYRDQLHFQNQWNGSGFAELEMEVFV